MGPALGAQEKSKGRNWLGRRAGARHGSPTKRHGTVARGKVRAFPQSELGPLPSGYKVLITNSNNATDLGPSRNVL